ERRKEFRVPIDSVEKHWVCLRILGVDFQSDANLMQVAPARGREGCLFRPQQLREKHGRKNGDNRNDDQQFDEREGGIAAQPRRHSNVLAAPKGQTEPSHMLQAETLMYSQSPNKPMFRIRVAPSRPHPSKPRGLAGLRQLPSVRPAVILSVMSSIATEKPPD